MPWQDLYAIKVNCINRNFYNYERFGHMVRHYKNMRTGGRIEKDRRLEYRRDENNGERRMIKGGNR